MKRDGIYVHNGKLKQIYHIQWPFRFRIKRICKNESNDNDNNNNENKVNIPISHKRMQRL